MKASSIAQTLNASWTSAASVVAVAIVLATLFGWALANGYVLVLVLVGLIALVPVFVRWPVVSTFGLYVLLVPLFDSVPYLVSGMSVVKPIAMVSVAVLMAVGLIERRLRRPPAAAVWWGLFMVWGLLSTAWAVDAAAVVDHARVMLSLFLLYLVAVSFRVSKHELYTVCLLTVIGGVIAAVLAYTFGLEDVAGDAARGRLVIGERESNPNALGQVLMLPLALAIAGFVVLRKLLHRAVILGLVGLIGVGIYISMSRAALVAMLTMIAVLLRRMRVRKSIVVPIVVLVIVGTTMPDQFYARVESVVTGEDSTGAGRTDVWKIGFEALREFGVIGAGWNNFVTVHGQYVRHGPRRFVLGAHNDYLATWVELGIVGLVLMLAALGGSLIGVWKLGSARSRGFPLSALEAACFGVLALSMFADNVSSKFFWLPWILLSWATACEREARFTDNLDSTETVERFQ